MSERVAVILPVYNHAHYVGEALESVLAQTRRPDRIIVVDDGSKDNSLKVLEAFRPREVEVHGQANQGAHATLNRLVEMAATDCEWIAILNSDDRFLPDRLAHCLQATAQQPGKSVFTTGLRVIDDKGSVMPESAPRARWFHGAWSIGQVEGITLPEWLGQANFVATTSNILARSSYLRRYPFRPYRFNHDYFFLASAAFEDQLAVLPEVLLEYRTHGSNTISTRPEPLIREMIRMHLDLYRVHAAALQRDAEVRKRFYGFVRGSWDSISSFHAGLGQVALAQLAAGASEEALEGLVHSLAGPEFDEFPNRLLAGSFDGTGTLTTGAVLGRKVDELKISLAKAKKDREALDQLSRRRQKLLQSRWIRLGLLMGIVHQLLGNQGKDPTERAERLREACRNHWWLKLGAKAGSKSARELCQDSAS